MKKNTIIQGDVRLLASSLPIKSINTIITSPSYYGLRDYGKKDQIGQEDSPETYIETLVSVFRELRKSLRDDGTLWLNLGDTYIKKRLQGIPWRVALALQDDGWYLRSDIIWHKSNGMPASVKDRVTTCHEYIFLLSKKKKYYFDQDAIREPYKDVSIARLARGVSSHHKNIDGAPGQPPHSMNKPRANINKAATFKRTGSKREQPIPNQTYGTHRPNREDTLYNKLGRNKRSVWTVSVKPYSGSHFAVFPPDLIEPCVLAGCPPGGIVLDPFFGSGTTGEVCLSHGRNYLGIELNPAYIELAEQRLSNVQINLLTSSK